MSNTEMENKNNTPSAETVKEARAMADVEVIVQSDLKELYSLELFLAVAGCPDLCVGFEFADNAISMFTGLDGTPTKLTVEAPVEAGAAMEYTPFYAVKALLAEAGITINEDNGFCANEKAAGARSLSEAFADIKASWADTVYTASELKDAVHDAYTDLEWD